MSLALTCTLIIGVLTLHGGSSSLAPMATNTGYSCNYVVYSGKMYASNICYFDMNLGKFIMWFCQFGLRWQYPNNNKTCNQPPDAAISLDASWFCNGTHGTCGWNQINNCDQPMERQMQQARPFGVCQHTQSNTTTNAGSDIYKCCPDKKTVVYDFFDGSSRCDPTDPGVKVIRQYFNATCHKEMNIFRQASNVICSSTDIVPCPNIKTDNPSLPPSLFPTLFPTRHPSRRPTTTATTTAHPNITGSPSLFPTWMPSLAPTNQPTKRNTTTMVPHQPTGSPFNRGFLVFIIFLCVVVCWLCFYYCFYCRCAEYTYLPSSSGGTSEHSSLLSDQARRDVELRVHSAFRPQLVNGSSLTTSSDGTASTGVLI